MLPTIRPGKGGPATAGPPVDTDSRVPTPCQRGFRDRGSPLILPEAKLRPRGPPDPPYPDQLWPPRTPLAILLILAHFGRKGRKPVLSGRALGGSAGLAGRPLRWYSLKRSPERTERPETGRNGHEGSPKRPLLPIMRHTAPA